MKTLFPFGVLIVLVVTLSGCLRTQQAPQQTSTQDQQNMATTESETQNVMQPETPKTITGSETLTDLSGEITRSLILEQSVLGWK